MAAHREPVRFRPGEQSVGAGKVEAFGAVPYPLPFKLVLGHDQPAFGGDDAAIFGIGKGAADLPRPAKADGGAEAAAAATGGAVERLADTCSPGDGCLGRGAKRQSGGEGETVAT